MKEIIKQHEEKMGKTIDVLSKELAAIRAGRANPGVLNKLTVEYYGTPTPLPQVAAVSSPDPRTLQIQPWDASILRQIEKAIQTSDLGLNPQNDGKCIRLSFPPLTEERRKELIKQCSKTGEEAKVAIRNIRRDAMDKFKDRKKKSEMTEDEVKDAEQQMQKITDKYVKEIDGIVAKKSKELAEV
nr:ribosome recycling factor [uncultured Butyricicoccus sp.]